LKVTASRQSQPDEIDRLIAEMKGEVPEELTDTQVVQRGMAGSAKRKGSGTVNNRSLSQQAALNEQRLMDLSDPFDGGLLDLSDPAVRAEIEREQANDIELKVDEDRVRAAQREKDLELEEILDDRLNQLSVQINDLKGQTTGFPVGVTSEERIELKKSEDSIKERLRIVQDEFDVTKKILDNLRIKLSPNPVIGGVEETKPVFEPGVVNVYNRESGPAFPERDRFKTRQKLREAETGEKTLPRFFKDDFVGNISEQAFNLPVKRSVTVPLTSGQDAVFTDSEAMQRNREGIFGIPGVELQNTAIGRALSTPYEFYGELIKLPFAEANIGSGLGDRVGLQGKTGGVMFTPTAPQGRPVDEERLTQQIQTRKNIIDANNDEIKLLNEQISGRRSGARIGDLTARIALLEDDNDQKRAELRQLDRISNAYVK
tara:strand:- start:8591 stop:9880 length:1290 start_codon:yes stop_codon:yes gene_type:complete